MTGTMTTLANRLRILSMRVPDLDVNLLEDAASELEKLAVDAAALQRERRGRPAE